MEWTKSKDMLRGMAIIDYSWQKKKKKKKKKNKFYSDSDWSACTFCVFQDLFI